MAESIGLRAVLDLSNFRKGLGAYTGGIAKMGKTTDRFAKTSGKQFAGLGKGLLKFGAIAGGAALVGIGALAAGILTLGVISIKTAISFESAFAGVVKTTDGLTSSIGVLNEAGKALRQGFVDLSKEVPLAFEELAAIGELGGQLGIGEAALLQFTESVAALGVATNLSTEEAATGLARIGNIFGVATDQMGGNIEQLGSTIVALGNNFATTERDILLFGQRMAGAGAIVGLTQAQVLSIGAAMSSVGVEAEAGGTAVQKVLLAMNNAVNATTAGFVDNSKAIDQNVTKLTKLNADLVRAEAATGLTGEAMVQMRDEFIATGGTAEEFGRQLGDRNRQKLLEAQLAINRLTQETMLLRETQGQPISPEAIEKFASVAGKSADEFKAAWQEDAAGAFQDFVEGLAAEGDNAVNVLADLGLEDQRLIRAFLSLAGAGDLLGEALDLGSKAFEENTALAKEAAQRYATTESQLLILKNTFRAAGDIIGSKFLPLLNRTIGVGKNVIEKFAGPLADILDKQVIPAIDSFIKKIKGLIAAFQAGGLFGARAGSFGSVGLLAALGIPPDIIGTIQTIFNEITAVFVGFQEGGVLAGFQNLGQRFWDWLTVIALPQLPGILSQVWTTLSALLVEGWESTIRPVLEEQGLRFWDWINTAVIPALPGVLTQVITGITSFLSEQFPVIQAATFEWATKFWEWVSEVTATAQQSLALILATIGQWALSGGTQQQLADMGIALGEAIVRGITFLVENDELISEIIMRLVEGLAAGVLVAAGLLIVIGGQIVAGILEGIVNSITDGNLEATTFNELGAVLSGIAANALLAAKLIGTNIMLGISQGILDGIADLTTTLNQIGEIITTVVSDFLGIASPSTVFFTFGVDIIQGLIDGILSLAGSLPDILSGLFGDFLGGDGVSGLLGGLFGGGDAAGGLDLGALDLSSLTESLTNILPAIQEVQAALGLITTESLPALTVTMLTTTATFSSSLLQILAQVLQVDVAIQSIYLVTLPTLLSTTVATATAMTAAFLSIIPSVNQLIAVITVLAATIVTAKNAAVTMADALVSGFDDATGAAEDLAEAIEEVTEEMKKLGDASSQLASAAGTTASVAAGIGFSGGIGLRGGLGLQQGLGVVIPPGHPNDSFGPLFVESGERMLVIPRGGPTVEELVARRGGVAGGSVVTVTNIFNTTINNALDEQVHIQLIKRVVGGIA